MTESISQLNHQINEVFSEMTAVIDSLVLKTVNEDLSIYFSKLENESGIVVEKCGEIEGRYMLRGNWEQMVSAREKIKNNFNTSVDIPNSESCQTEFSCSNKAVTCDIMKGEVLRRLSSTQSNRRTRIVSVIIQRARSPSRRIKEKYRAKRRNGCRPMKKLMNSALKASNKLSVGNAVFAQKIANREGVDVSKDSCPPTPENNPSDDCLNSENVEPTTAGEKFCERTKSKPKKNYEELTPFKFFCKLCSFKTKRESHYQKHLAIHNKVTTLYKCEECSFTSIRLSHMRRHEMSHSQTTYSCPQCTYKTDDMKLLVRHMKIKHERMKMKQEHEEENSSDLLHCPECPYTTTKQYHYQRHLRVHDGSTRGPTQMFQCDQCVYKTSRKEHFIRHVNNVHSNNRPYLCDFCGKAFKRTDALKQHRVTHASVDPRGIQFRCSVCDKNCRSHAHLIEHQAVHSNVRSFLCEICGASFKTRSVQRKHVLNIHKKPRAYSCEVCDKRFNTNYALRRHVRLHDTSTDLNCPASPIPQIGSSAEAVTIVSSDGSEQNPNAITQQSVILVPTSEGHLQAETTDLTGTTTIPFTIHPGVGGGQATIQLAASVLGGTAETIRTDGTALLPISDGITADDIRTNSQGFIQTTNDAPTTLLYLTTNFTPF